jgi:aspartyl-tRNA(Asn)/glutamyl-tRNA(Gln) amidotransferase subunit A
MFNRQIAQFTASELSEAFRKHVLSPVEAAEAALVQIEELNERFGAYGLVDREATLASARAAEARWMKGTPLSPIDGVTTSIKDLCLTKGWPTLRGSRTVDSAGPWVEDSPCVARLREAGAVLLGKTTTPERGWKGVTDNPLGQVARNPWDSRQTAGGSSGGVAVAAALGMGGLHIGTDGGGSIRIPAAFSGVFGMKPTYGRVPAYPESPMGDLAHIGPITRSVTDAALMLDIIARPDGRDWQSLPQEPRSFTTDLDAGVSGLRIAWSCDLGFVSVDPEIEDISGRAAKQFQSLGAEVVELNPALRDPIDIFHMLWFTGAATALREIPAERYNEIDAGLVEISHEGMFYDHMAYMDALRARAEFARAVSSIFDSHDLLLTPTMPISTFEAGFETPPGSDFSRWTEWTGFTYPFNLTQQPAASIPCGFTVKGLPVGLQIIGPRHADALVLRAARAFETINPIVLPRLPKMTR